MVRHLLCVVVALCLVASAHAGPREALELAVGRVPTLQELRSRGGDPANFAARAHTSALAKLAAVGTDPERYKWDGEAYTAGLAVAADDAVLDAAMLATARRYAAVVIGTAGVLPEWRVKPRTLAWLAHRDPASGLPALGLPADEYSRRFWRLTRYGQVEDELNARLLTWYVELPMYAALLDAPPGRNPYTGQTWNHAAIAREAYEYGLSTQAPNGSLPIPPPDTGFFQWGMLAGGLSNYERLVVPGDPRPARFAAGVMEWLFENVYLPAEHTFPYSATDRTSSTDNNGFSAAAIAAAMRAGHPEADQWRELLLHGTLDSWWFHGASGAWQLDIALRWLPGLVAAGDSPTTPPAPPASLRATPSITAPAVRLDWSDEADNEDHFVVEVSVNGGPFQARPPLPPNTVSWLIQPVAPGALLEFRLAAENASGRSAWATTRTVAAPFSVPGDALNFGRVRLGRALTLSLPIRNLMPDTLELGLGAASPFKAAPASVQIAGTSTSTVRVSFRPTRLGPVDGTLSIRWGGHEYRVALRGTGVRR